MPHHCEICGAEFDKDLVGHAAKTCSVECSRALAARNNEGRLRRMKEENPALLRERRRKWRKNYRAKHPETEKACEKRYRERHREELREKTRTRYKKLRDAGYFREWFKKRREKERMKKAAESERREMHGIALLSGTANKGDSANIQRSPCGACPHHKSGFCAVKARWVSPIMPCCDYGVKAIRNERNRKRRNGALAASVRQMDSGGKSPQSSAESHDTNPKGN